MAVIDALMFILGMAIGLYSGKKRAAGEGWHSIFMDLMSDMYMVVMYMWRKLSGPFRKGRDADAGVEDQ